MGRGIAFATFVAGGLIVADLWAHGNVTKSVLGFATGESKLLAGQKA
jgi:hypothetical protein